MLRDIPAAPPTPWRHRVRVFLEVMPRMFRDESGEYSVADVIAVQDSVDLRNFARMASRMKQTRLGRDLLRTRPRLRPTMGIDLDEMATLPDGTLGKELWRHMTDNGITDDVDVNMGFCVGDGDTEYAKVRYRETHDIRHLLLDRSVNVHDEIIVQFFQLAQHFNWLSIVIISAGLIKHGFFEGAQPTKELFVDGVKAFRSGFDAEYLLGLPWEEMWDQQLEELRARYGVIAVPSRPASKAN